ncbi:MAG: hypothetical protein IID55_02330 [Proteobacteria bacterium]|nr:hypothetical protein [Pseudomonadota bacterium]
MSVAEAEQSPEQEPSPPPSPGGTALLRGRIEIDLGARLREFETGDTRVFATLDQQDPGRPMMAYVCRCGVPVRNKPLAAFKGKMPRNLLSVVTDGLIPVPGSDELLFAVVLEKPKGVSAAEAVAERGKPFDERTVGQEYLTQFVVALRELEAAGVTHRAIRPDNVFFTDAKQETLLLGEFITSPAGSRQPSAFEPIESAQAMPDGRGIGTMLHDTYALGVTLLSMLSGSVPGEGRDPVELMDERLTQSSFTALAGSFKAAATILDLLRGLMCDDISERWGLDEIDAWLRGRRFATKRAVLSQRAIRPFAFESRDHTYDLALAAAFARHPKEAAKAIASEEFLDWLRVGLQRPRLGDTLIEMLGTQPQGKRDGPTLPGKIDPVTIGTILLDPMGPLRRDEVSIAIDGFGPVLATAFTKKDQNLKTSIMRLLASEAPKEWIKQRREVNSDLSSSTGIFSRLLVVGSSKALGFGPERCLYELNAGYPCLSPFVAKYWVSELPRLLTALDDAAATADKSTDLLDRHIAAFIGTYLQQSDKMMMTFSNTANQDKAMLSLELFAMLQARLDMPNMKNLTRWLGVQLEPFVAGFHSRTRRDYARARIAVAQQKGDITLLLELVNSLRSDSSDETQFGAAKTKFADNRVEIGELASGSRKVVDMGRAMGAKAARLISFIMLLMSAALLIIGVSP